MKPKFYKRKKVYSTISNVNNLKMCTINNGTIFCIVEKSNQGSKGLTQYEMFSLPVKKSTETQVKELYVEATEQEFIDLKNEAANFIIKEGLL